MNKVLVSAAEVISGTTVYPERYHLTQNPKPSDIAFILRRKGKKVWLESTFQKYRSGKPLISNIDETERLYVVKEN